MSEWSEIKYVLDLLGTILGALHDMLAFDAVFYLQNFIHTLSEHAVTIDALFMGRGLKFRRHRANKKGYKLGDLPQDLFP